MKLGPDCVGPMRVVSKGKRWREAIKANSESRLENPSHLNGLDAISSLVLQ